MKEKRDLHPPFGRSLSARLLVLTIFFVTVIEVAVFTPSIARFRERYLEERLATGHLAILALDASSDHMVSEALAMELLDHAGAYAIVQMGPGPVNRMLSLEKPPKADTVIDLRTSNFIELIAEAFVTLAQNDNRVLRVQGYSPKREGALIELNLDETPMREAMYGYSWRVLGLSIAIAMGTACLVYFSLQWLMVAPMRRLSESMIAFQEDPENMARIIKPGKRGDEIGMAERELAAMQTDLHAALGQKARLAALGGAMAKVNHDLRNLLATASLLIEMLSDSVDENVRKVTPRLFETIDRAVDLCRHTLDFARDEGPKLRPERFELRPLIGDCFESLKLETSGEFEVAWENKVDDGQILYADREQLFRVVTNLGRNAAEAGARNVVVSAQEVAGACHIMLADNGPGLPERAQESLYQPFKGSVRAGGTGLGLAIVREIMRAHGGDVELKESGDEGTVFCLVFPPQPDAEAA